MALRATGVVYRQLDRVVLGALIATVAVASFDVADKGSMVGLTALGVATSALIPAAAAMSVRDPGQLRQLVLLATRGAAFVTLPVAMFLVVAASPVVRVLAGSELPGAAPALRWLSAAAMVAVVYAAVFEMAIGSGGAPALAPLSVIGVAINVAGTLALARPFGAAGSAAASFLATAALAPFVTHRALRVFAMRWTDLIAPLLEPVAVAGATGTGAFLGQVVSATVAGAAVGAALAATGALAVVARRGGLDALRRTSFGRPA
jgi:O-antigen/teichoic acid export membrane protein